MRQLTGDVMPGTTIINSSTSRRPVNGITPSERRDRPNYGWSILLQNVPYSVVQTLTESDQLYPAGIPLPDGSSGISPRQPGELPDMWVPPQNWPLLLVKGEIDPSIITGTIRYGGYNSSLYGEAIGEAGRVWAKMETKLDPYTGSTLTTCPAESSPGQSNLAGCTDAIGYWNNTAQGHYEVEGVASGIYTIYAEAAGYPQSVIESNVTILKGQSLHFDGYLQPGPVIHGNVFSKHQFGDEPMAREIHTLRLNYMMRLRSATFQVQALTWSHGHHYLASRAARNNITGNSAANCGDPRTGSLIAFPWHEYSTVCANIPAAKLSITVPKQLDPDGNQRIHS